MGRRYRSSCLVACTICFALSVRGAEIDARSPEKGNNSFGQVLKRMARVRLPGEYERGHATVTGAFRDVVATSSRSTVRVLCDGMQSALGVVVRADGLVLTKASELDGKLECIFFDGSRDTAVKVAQRDDFDLALLQVPKKNILEISWSEGSVLPVGSWLITTNLEPLPVAIGVVSAPLHDSPMPRAVLGVKMNPVAQGVRVNVVFPGTGAARAGIREGDVIASINGRLADSTETITEVIGGLHPGDKVTLSVFREQEPLSLTATLGDKTRLGGLDQAELMDSLGGPLSKRRAGFPSVIQHDSVVRPRECGGPIVDLDGKAVGINIARASRVATLALPANVVRLAVQEMMRNVATPPLGRDPTGTVATSQDNSATP